MFAILPTSDDYCVADAEWFNDLDHAYDSAFDWSVELNGQQVNIYEDCQGKLNLITTVFA